MLTVNESGVTMATVTYVPVEAYLRSSDYEPDAEYVDGQIEERPMGEFDHSDWQAAGAGPVESRRTNSGSITIS